MLKRKQLHVKKKRYIGYKASPFFSFFTISDMKETEDNDDQKKANIHIIIFTNLSSILGVIKIMIAPKIRGNKQ